ncbi:ABC transporter permease [Metamycoplasma phocicerebrale]|uniref:ABC transporter permease n=1 Tax=Metamycoplasma phocicerebrale TaxID=142649 RepID=A0A3T0TU33_9BACT|nr:ABC transporter permease [Metamycoplasma phocicerebrale]AZZ65558.1 ABC transporter permease [Metamycoplasma phocicerebrale]
MPEQNINEFNKKYKINSNLAKKFNFIAEKDRIQTSSIAGKPKKMWIEVIKRFFTNPIVIISLAVFLTIILLSILIPATSQFKPNEKITGSDYIKYLPPYSTPTITRIVESDGEIFKFYQNVLSQANANPMYKKWLKFYLDSVNYELINGTTSIKMTYNAYFFVFATHINEFINDNILLGNTITDSMIAEEMAKYINIYSNVLLGTSSIGYDIWVTSWYATWRAIKIALIVVLIEGIIGISIGAFLGFHAGKLVDTICMRIIEIFSSPPTLIWILLFVSILGTNQWALIFALSIVGWPGFVGITRMFVITIKDEEYIKAAKAIGASTGRQIFIHALPGIIGKIANSLVKAVPGVILWIASLAFLGFFKETGDINLGQMLIQASSESGSNLWIIALPTIILLLLSLSLNFIALGVHDALDPKVMSKGRK